MHHAQIKLESHNESTRIGLGLGLWGCWWAKWQELAIAN